MANHKALISYITLAVTDLNKMKSFYSDLGFELYSESEDINHSFTMYKSGSLILALYSKQLLAKQAGIFIENSDTNNALSLSLNVDSKQAVDFFLKKAKQVNTEITKEGFEPVWGGYCGYFKDPENNLWEIVWNEKFVFPD